ncbi:DUF3592 domain-containing protein [Methylomonas rapida]|uniref:DUF3592 domain-containing protein n=1 Tax=Methylomonas rapida TaxID=2963939 RepID=A0ABY7GDM8_9GAMM|nr:DUF3592 domain-containing protein [Methylomonas rapida]WAR43389.1 DUF3592 domain-containing protein [Methylomonas rapida]
MIQEFPRLRITRHLKQFLAFGLVLLLALILYRVMALSYRNIEMYLSWPRQTAYISSLAHEETIELEVAQSFFESLPPRAVPESCYPHENDRTCILLPRSPYLWDDLMDEIEIVQNPQKPDELAFLSFPVLWLPVFGYAGVALICLGFWRWLRQATWGEDVTWMNGAWVPTPAAPQRVGFDEFEPVVIRETGENRKSVIFWALLLLLLTGVLLPLALQSLYDDPLQAFLLIAAVVVVAVLLFYQAGETFSRAVYQSRSGLIDSSLFCVKRVPWSAVAALELENVNAMEQTTGRRVSTQSSALDRYVVRDAQGRTILCFSENMQPGNGFRALLKKLENQTDKNSQANDGLHASPERFQAEWRGDSADLQRLRRLHRQGMRWGYMIVVLPFLLLTAVLCFKALWFTYAAERAQGRVVEIKNDRLPSLVVEYRVGQGRILRLESDGAEPYGAFKVGDSLTVFYDATNPENARPDLFLELWLLPMLMGGLTLIVLIPAWLMGRD